MSELTPRQRKQALRLWAKELPKVCADRLIERFLELEQVRDGKTFFLFYGVGKEPDTEHLIRRLLEDGKRIALPVCLPQGKMEAREIGSLDELRPGSFGIPEPGEACPPISGEEIDVVLVPNLLCDRRGYRLGRGGGYYDRWLENYSGLTVCICPPERLVDELPREPFDRPVKIVISR